jgi:hypothetical protein
MLGLIATSGVIVFGSGMQVLGAGNTKDLLDDVGNFPEHWTQDDGRHRVRGSANTGYYGRRRETGPK